MLVCTNAMLYNKYDTPFYKTAQRIKASVSAQFGELEQRLGVTTSDNADGMDFDGAAPTEKTVADLEPSMEMVELLTQEDAIKHDTDLILDTEPIVSLFNLERARFKPPPPPPTPPPPKPKRAKLPKAEKKSKPTRNYKAERERVQRQRVHTESGAAQFDALDAAPGFRVRTTRGGAARVAAFEAEAGAPVASGSDVPLTAPVPIAIPTDVGEGPSISQGGKRRRRKPQQTRPEQSEVLPLVEDMDPHKSFKMFDAGWILPEGQKRRRGVPASREVDTPPPRRAASVGKKGKTYAGKSSEVLSNIIYSNKPF
jgi:hypothetical protein